MKDHADGVAVTRANAADAMPHVDAITAADPLDRAVAHRLDRGVAATQRHHLNARLHPWPLLGQNELTPGKILVRL